jgi:hypothetical protein
MAGMDYTALRRLTKEFEVHHQLSDLDLKDSSSPIRLSWSSMRTKVIASQARTDGVAVAVPRSYLRAEDW